MVSKHSKYKFCSGLIYFLALCILGSCSEKEVQTAHQEATPIATGDLAIESLDFSAMPFKTLSEYGFFTGYTADLKPSDGVIPYVPASSLFTDYAQKSRFLWHPSSSKIKLIADIEGTFDFPDSSILIKNFFYPRDLNQIDGPVDMVETRLLIKRGGVWEAFPYVWNEAQTDATYKVTGGEREVSWLDVDGTKRKINYLIPNKNQCKSCHNFNESLMPIGVKGKYLSLPSGSNQVEAMISAGRLERVSNFPDHVSMINYSDEKEALELRARAYLDINCAHCHRAEGPASTSGLFLTYEEKDPLKLGIFKTPVAAGFGAGSFTYDIFPGKAEASILIHRMGSNQVGVAMPEIGRVTVHQEGLGLIKQWINSLKQ
jgi:uncharacterized repeat protein (TIGR03806 family)